MIIGGTGNDTITANRGETGLLTDGSDVVVGDTGFVDFAIADQNPTTLDRVWTTDPGTGGSDNITTGNSSDVVIGGDAGDTIRPGTATTSCSATTARSRCSAASGRPPSAPIRASTHRRRAATTQITTGTGNDVVIGGLGKDTIDAGSGNNVVLGDSGELDFDPTAAGALQDGVLDRTRRSATTTRSRPVSAAT